MSGLPAELSFSVVSEMLLTTVVAPYQLTLSTDNPSITLAAQQKSETASHWYNWLAGCQTGAPRPGIIEIERHLQVRVLGNPVEGEPGQG